MPVPVNGVIGVGVDTCLPPAGQSLRLSCQTTPVSRPVTWETFDGSTIVGSEFVDVTGAGEYTCLSSDGCGQTVNASSEVFSEFNN